MKYRSPITSKQKSLKKGQKWFHVRSFNVKNFGSIFRFSAVSLFLYYA